MTQEDKRTPASNFGSRSTGLKMLLILSFGLLPLGLIAMLASIQSARENSARRTEETQARVEIQAQRIDSSLSRSALTIRAASAAIAATPPGSGICRTTLQRLTSVEVTPGRYALFSGDGSLRCVTPGYMPPPELLDARGRRSIVDIGADGRSLRFALFDQGGRIQGAGEFTREGLARLIDVSDTHSAFDLALVRGDRTMWLRNGFEGGPLVQTLRARAPVAQGALELRIASGARPVGPEELLIMILPVAMWVFAAIIVWYIVNQLLLKPLVRMQKAISTYQPGDEGFDMPRFRTPAREIGELGEAFARVTRTVARHEADLEAAVERQKRLVREVHHRVKNNLQVVASLLNLHSRGSPNEDVAAAYASIQRRVDALAVVHRNHYAELEENRGVALKPLISELGANLRATAPASASHMVIRLDIEPYYVTQDVAVSVAFLITEIVEFAMFCEGKPVTISLRGETPGLARLTVESDSLHDDVACDAMLSDRFDRIVTGLSRQLRSNIHRDGASGSYALDVTVIDKAER